jgi:hypothetical protein
VLRLDDAGDCLLLHFDCPWRLVATGGCLPLGMGYARRRGAQRDAGADDCFVREAGGVREGLVSDRSGIIAEGDTYWLAV